MLTSETREIAGRKYVITQLGTGEGLPILVKLFKILGPALGAAFKVADVTDPKQGFRLGPQGIGELITELAARVSPEDLNHLVDVFAKSTQVDMGDGRVLQLSTIKGVEFAGKYGALFQWLRACIEINYADFLGELTSIALRS